MAGGVIGFHLARLTLRARLASSSRPSLTPEHNDMAEFNPKGDVECLEPNLVTMRLQGKVEQRDLSTLFDRFEPFVVDQPFFLIAVDMREVKGATPEARRIAADRLASLPKFYIAVITAGFAQRMIAKLVLTAHEMLNRGHSTSGFFDDDDSAKAWLLERGEAEKAAARG